MNVIWFGMRFKSNSVGHTLIAFKEYYALVGIEFMTYHTNELEVEFDLIVSDLPIQKKTLEDKSCKLILYK